MFSEKLGKKILWHRWNHMLDIVNSINTLGICSDYVKRNYKTEKVLSIIKFILSYYFPNQFYDSKNDFDEPKCLTLLLIYWWDIFTYALGSKLDRLYAIYLQSLRNLTTDWNLGSQFYEIPLAATNFTPLFNPQEKQSHFFIPFIFLTNF